MTARRDVLPEHGRGIVWTAVQQRTASPESTCMQRCLPCAISAALHAWQSCRGSEARGPAGKMLLLLVLVLLLLLLQVQTLTS